jgi:hypothetical protein
VISTGMGFSSSITDPTVADGPYISKQPPKVTRFKLSDMAVTMDTQMPQHDDLSQDTLMGLQELDSHLAIFESSNPGRDSSTPGAISNSPFEDSMNTVEQPSHTIIVDSPGNRYSQQNQSEVRSRARPIGTKSVYSHITQYVAIHHHDMNLKMTTRKIQFVRKVY